MRISDLSPRAQALHALVDFDPISTVCQLLSEEGHPHADGWLTYLGNDVVLSNATNQQKRVLVNNAWRRIFGDYQISSGINTEHPRYCLVDNCELNVWIVLFYQSVVPAIIDHKLPQ
jgi:hypothetical protein